MRSSSWAAPSAATSSFVYGEKEEEEEEWEANKEGTVKGLIVSSVRSIRATECQRTMSSTRAALHARSKTCSCAVAQQHAPPPHSLSLIKDNGCCLESSQRTSDSRIVTNEPRLAPRGRGNVYAAVMNRELLLVSSWNVLGNVFCTLL